MSILTLLFIREATTESETSVSIQTTQNAVWKVWFFKCTYNKKHLMFCLNNPFCLRNLDGVEVRHEANLVARVGWLLGPTGNEINNKMCAIFLSPQSFKISRDNRSISDPGSNPFAILGSRNVRYGPRGGLRRLWPQPTSSSFKPRPTNFHGDLWPVRRHCTCLLSHSQQSTSAWA